MLVDANELIALLPALVGAMKIGLVFSQLEFVRYSLQDLLSRYSSVDKPDPTKYKRTFDSLFKRLFEPFGESVGSRTETPLFRAISFHLSVGIAVVLYATLGYIFTATIGITAAVVSYQSFGVTLDIVPTYRFIVALILLVGLAVMIQSWQRAKSFAVQP